MKIFIDANVIVSVFNKEYPLFTFSSRILSLGNYRKFELYTSPVCLAIAFYFSEKKSGNAVARKKIELLCGNINVTDTGFKEVQKAIFNKKAHDFEDGMEYYSAVHSGCKSIITEDPDDLYFSEIEVMNSEKFLQKYL